MRLPDILIPEQKIISPMEYILNKPTNDQCLFPHIDQSLWIESKWEQETSNIQHNLQKQTNGIYAIRLSPLLYKPWRKINQHEKYPKTFGKSYRELISNRIKMQNVQTKKYTHLLYLSHQITYSLLVHPQKNPEADESASYSICWKNYFRINLHKV